MTTFACFNCSRFPCQCKVCNVCRRAVADCICVSHAPAPAERKSKQEPEKPEAEDHLHVNVRSRQSLKNEVMGYYYGRDAAGLLRFIDLLLDRKKD